MKLKSTLIHIYIKTVFRILHLNMFEISLEAIFQFSAKFEIFEEIN